MGKSKNHLRVDKYRRLRGNDTLKEKYHILTFKYGIAPRQADKMKHWSVDRMLVYISDNNINITDKYFNSLRDVDKL